MAVVAVFVWRQQPPAVEVVVTAALAAAVPLSAVAAVLPEVE